MLPLSEADWMCGMEEIGCVKMEDRREQRTEGKDEVRMAGATGDAMTARTASTPGVWISSLVRPCGCPRSVLGHVIGEGVG